MQPAQGGMVNRLATALWKCRDKIERKQVYGKQYFN
jgi:hypothetical protein